MNKAIELVLLQALGRLIKGTPKDPRVKARLARGKPIVTPTCLQDESGHHRSLFAHANCTYQTVYRKLMQARSRAPQTAAFKALKESVACLKKENAELKTICASMCAELLELQQKETQRNASRFRRNDKRKR